MPRLALATSSKFPTLTEDDRLLLDPLAKHGIQAHPTIWNDLNQDWSACAAVLIRSCWDYHLAPEKFLACCDGQHSMYSPHCAPRRPQK